MGVFFLFGGRVVTEQEDMSDVDLLRFGEILDFHTEHKGMYRYLVSCINWITDTDARVAQPIMGDYDATLGDFGNVLNGMSDKTAVCLLNVENRIVLVLWCPKTARQWDLGYLRNNRKKLEILFKETEFLSGWFTIQQVEDIDYVENGAMAFPPLSDPKKTYKKCKKNLIKFCLNSCTGLLVLFLR